MSQFKRKITTKIEEAADAQAGDVHAKIIEVLELIDEALAEIKKATKADK
jgi:hypothetical protein